MFYGGLPADRNSWMKSFCDWCYRFFVGMALLICLRNAFLLMQTHHRSRKVQIIELGYLLPTEEIGIHLGGHPSDK